MKAIYPRLRQYEAYAGADPKRAGHLIACAYSVGSENRISNEFYVSFDHGSTWSHALTVPDAVDPSCAFARNGVAFAASIHDQAFPDGKTDSTLAVYRSVDGGRTWQQSPVGIDTRSVDRAYLTVDDSNSPFRNRVYVHGYFARRTPPPAVVFYQSTDAGQTSRSVQASGGD